MRLRAKILIDTCPVVAIVPAVPCETEDATGDVALVSMPLVVAALGERVVVREKAGSLDPRRLRMSWTRRWKTTLMAISPAPMVVNRLRQTSQWTTST